MVFFAVMNRRGSMCMRGLFVKLGCSLVRVFRHYNPPLCSLEPKRKGGNIAAALVHCFRLGSCPSASPAAFAPLRVFGCFQKGQMMFARNSFLEKTRFSTEPTGRVSSFLSE
jgi:hypothetical protein